MEPCDKLMRIIVNELSVEVKNLHYIQKKLMRCYTCKPWFGYQKVKNDNN